MQYNPKFHSYINKHSFINISDSKFGEADMEKRWKMDLSWSIFRHFDVREIESHFFLAFPMICCYTS